MRKDHKKPNYKLDEQTVRGIKTLQLMDFSGADIANLYDVQQSTVSMYKKGERQRAIEPLSSSIDPIVYDIIKRLFEKLDDHRTE